MKMLEEIKHYKKEYVYEQYTRIVPKYKKYDSVTKTKMLSEIYDVYSDYNNIINICTVRELKYLEKIINNKVEKIGYQEYMRRLMDRHYKEEYDWEKNRLREKFLIDAHFDDITIPEEIIDYVKNAIKKVDYKFQSKLDQVNEILVSYCKTQGSAILSSVCSFGSGIFEMSEQSIWQHMINNKLFRYYVYITSKDFDSLGDDIPFAIYQEYYGISDELKEQRKLQGLSFERQIDIRDFQTLFYNDFNINNPKIKTFLYKLEELPFFWNSALEGIKEFAMLNIDREPLKESIRNVPALKNENLDEFFKLMDEAMDEMPSGALNGLTPNEAKKIKQKEKEYKTKVEKNYHKQNNACLSEKDAKLFYKLYFALLEFTNNKYKINLSIKIYNQKGINPYLIIDIVEKFWENKDSIIIEFCFANPYKFNKEELQIISELKKGFRDIFVISKYESEYTAFMFKDKVYMVKGLHDNIDNLISYKDLPYITRTAIMPFKNRIIYDGMLPTWPIHMSNDFNEMIDKEYNRLIKYYHL